MDFYLWVLPHYSTISIEPLQVHFHYADSIFFLNLFLPPFPLQPVCLMQWHPLVSSLSTTLSLFSASLFKRASLNALNENAGQIYRSTDHFVFLLVSRRNRMAWEDIDLQPSQLSSSSSSETNSPQQSSTFTSSKSFSFPNKQTSSGKSTSRFSSTTASPSSRTVYSRPGNPRVSASPIQKQKFNYSSFSSSSFSTGKHRSSTSESMDNSKNKPKQFSQQIKQTKSHSFSSSSLSDQMANLHLRDVSKQRSSLPTDPQQTVATSSSSSSFKLGEVIDRIFSEAFNDTR